MSWFSVKWKIGALSLATRSNNGFSYRLSFSFPVLTSEFEFTIALGEDLEMAAGETISWGNIANGRVQPHSDLSSKTRTGSAQFLLFFSKVQGLITLSRFLLFVRPVVGSHSITIRCAQGRNPA